MCFAQQSNQIMILQTTSVSYGRCLKKIMCWSEFPLIQIQPIIINHLTNINTPILAQFFHISQMFDFFSVIMNLKKTPHASMQQIKKEITETLKMLQLQSSSSVISMDTSCLLPVGRVKKSGWRTEVDDWRMCWNLDKRVYLISCCSRSTAAGW